MNSNRLGINPLVPGDVLYDLVMDELCLNRVCNYEKPFAIVNEEVNEYYHHHFLFHACDICECMSFD